MQSDAREGLWLLPFAFCLVCIGCAKRLVLPTDPGTPLQDVAALHAEISNACAGVRSLTAELALSGRAGDQTLRGRALAGFEAPDAMRLEALAPFGAPAFILVARGGRATLLLPRDGRVLEGAEPEDILGALTGVALGPADLQAILAGCVVPSPKPVRGWQHGDRWRTIELAGGERLYLQRTGDEWQLRAARRGAWQIEYNAWQRRFPRAVRLRSAEAPAVDMTAVISQLETNVPIDPAAFDVDVPRDAVPITLDELREAGPLRSAPATAPLPFALCLLP